jgi:putative ABC transport system permease protein
LYIALLPENRRNGIVRGGLNGPAAFVEFDALGEAMNQAGLARQLHVMTSRHDEQFQAEIGRRLEKHFKDKDIRVASTNLTAEIKRLDGANYDTIIMFLMSMGILLAIVGALGLMGTMSLNVLERTREIGIMRSIGAANKDVIRIIVTEGVLIGLISWGFGSLLAYPISKYLSDEIGISFLQAPLNYSYPPSGTLLWLLGVIFLSALASYMPAWNASRLTVRDVIAYE